MFIKYVFAISAISKFLSDLFNVSLSEKTYPHLLKSIEVISIFTNCDVQLVFLQFTKVFEKLLYICIYSYLIKCNLLSDLNSGLERTPTN